MEEAAKGGGGVSIHGDLLKPPGCGCWQVALGGPAGAGGGWTR